MTVTHSFTIAGRTGQQCSPRSAIFSSFYDVVGYRHLLWSQTQDADSGKSFTTLVHCKFGNVLRVT